jgi:hypothetical protein
MSASASCRIQTADKASLGCYCCRDSILEPLLPKWLHGLQNNRKPITLRFQRKNGRNSMSELEVSNAVFETSNSDIKFLPMILRSDENTDGISNLCNFNGCKTDSFLPSSKRSVCHDKQAMFDIVC